MPLKDPEARRAYNRSPERMEANRQRVLKFQREHPEEWKAIHDRANAKYRTEHPDRHHAAQEKWREENREQYLESQRNGMRERRKVLKQTDPERLREFNRRRGLRPQQLAVQAVRSAIRGGLRPPPTTLKCEHCGEPAKVYHHTHGYDPANWFDVIPLCTPCHHKCHRHRKKA